MRGKLIEDVQARFDPGPLYLTWPTVANVTTTERFVGQVVLRWERGADIILEALKLLEEEQEDQESLSERAVSGGEKPQGQAAATLAGRRRHSEHPAVATRLEVADRTLGVPEDDLSPPRRPGGHDTRLSPLLEPGGTEFASRVSARAGNESAEPAVADLARADRPAVRPDSPPRAASRRDVSGGGTLREGAARPVREPIRGERRERPESLPDEPQRGEALLSDEQTWLTPRAPGGGAESLQSHASGSTPNVEDCGAVHRVTRPSTPMRGDRDDTWPVPASPLPPEALPVPGHTFEMLLSERLRREAALHEWEGTSF